MIPRMSNTFCCPVLGSLSTLCICPMFCLAQFYPTQSAPNL